MMMVMIMIMMEGSFWEEAERPQGHGQGILKSFSCASSASTPPDVHVGLAGRQKEQEGGSCLEPHPFLILSSKISHRTQPSLVTPPPPPLLSPDSPRDCSEPLLFPVSAARRAAPPLREKVNTRRCRVGGLAGNHRLAKDRVGWHFPAAPSFPDLAVATAPFPHVEAGRAQSGRVDRDGTRVTRGRGAR
ncbi:hypothetical protein VPH35_048045 [Triticum aestivum]